MIIRLFFRPYKAPCITTLKKKKKKAPWFSSYVKCSKKKSVLIDLGLSIHLLQYNLIGKV